MTRHTQNSTTTTSHHYSFLPSTVVAAEFLFTPVYLLARSSHIRGWLKMERGRRSVHNFHLYTSGTSLDFHTQSGHRVWIHLEATLPSKPALHTQLRLDHYLDLWGYQLHRKTYPTADGRRLMILHWDSPAITLKPPPANIDQRF